MYNCVTRIYHELTTLWRMKKFLTPSMSLIWQDFITCFDLLLMTSLIPGDRHGPSTVCGHLWVSGQMNSTPDGDQGPEQLMHYGVERVVGGDDHEIADNAGLIFYSSAEEVLTDGVLSALQREKPFQSHLENFGIGSFIKAKTIIKVNYAE